MEEVAIAGFSRVHIKGLVLGFWSKGVEMTKKVAEVVGSSRNGAGGGEEEGVVVEMGEWI